MATRLSTMKSQWILKLPSDDEEEEEEDSSDGSDAEDLPFCF